MVLSRTFEEKLYFQGASKIIVLFKHIQALVGTKFSIPIRKFHKLFNDQIMTIIYFATK